MTKPCTCPLVYDRCPESERLWRIVRIAFRNAIALAEHGNYEGWEVYRRAVDEYSAHSEGSND